MIAAAAAAGQRSLEFIHFRQVERSQFELAVFDRQAGVGDPRPTIVARLPIFVWEAVADRLAGA